MKVKGHNGSWVENFGKWELYKIDGFFERKKYRIEEGGTYVYWSIGLSPELAWIKLPFCAIVDMK